MKIAIIGAHGVGKTTLAEALLENLPGYTLEAEPYYELGHQGMCFQKRPRLKILLISLIIRQN